MNPDSKHSSSFRFPSRRLSEVDFKRLDQVREAIIKKARRTVDPDGKGFDMLMQSDDGGFFPTGDDYDWRDRINEVILVASRRISLAILSVGFAIAGASLISAGAVSYGQTSLLAAGAFGFWAGAANVFGARSQR